MTHGTWARPQKKDTHYVYKVQDIDTKEGAPFTIGLYFKEQDSNGNWVVPVFVVENNGHVINGTLSLGDNLAPLSRGSQVPKEMNDYIGGYRDALTWLEAFTTSEQPESLKAVTWGKLACIGCGTLDPAGPDKINVAGNTYDTTVLVNHLGQTDSKIWISKELPYPVKAQTYAAVTTGQPPVQYAFELVETGSGAPKVPAGTANIPTSPIVQTTGRGTYQITLDWSPEAIRPGNETTFTVKFTDSKGVPQQNVNFDFKVSDSNGTVIKDIKDQFTGETSAKTVKLALDKAGPVTITVTINSVEGKDTGTFVESTDFNIVAVPEFPLWVFLPVVVAAGIGATIFASRRLFR